MNTEQQIEGKIKKAKSGTLFFAEDFATFGSKTAIYTALHRIAKRKLLTRVSQGIYVKPEISSFLNQEILPSVDEVAEAIAKRDKARIMPSGAFAQYALGLSTQIPLRSVYYTDGKARTIKIGNTTLLLKKISPKKLALKGDISKLVVLALSDIGNGKQTKKEEDKIIELLKKEKISDLKHDITLAPQWIAEIMAKAL